MVIAKEWDLKTFKYTLNRKRETRTTQKEVKFWQQHWHATFSRSTQVRDNLASRFTRKHPLYEVTSLKYSAITNRWHNSVRANFPVEKTLLGNFFLVGAHTNVRAMDGPGHYPRSGKALAVWRAPSLLVVLLFGNGQPQVLQHISGKLANNLSRAWS